MTVAKCDPFLIVADIGFSYIPFRIGAASFRKAVYTTILALGNKVKKYC